MMRSSTSMFLRAKTFLMAQWLPKVRLPPRFCLLLKINVLLMFHHLSFTPFYYCLLYFVRIILRQWRALFWVLYINLYPCWVSIISIAFSSVAFIYCLLPLFCMPIVIIACIPVDIIFHIRPSCR